MQSVEYDPLHVEDLLAWLVEHELPTLAYILVVWLLDQPYTSRPLTLVPRYLERFTFYRALVGGNQSEEISNALNLLAKTDVLGTPLLTVDRTYYNPAGRAVQWDIMLGPAVNSYHQYRRNRY